jgi:hypothetical protein
MFGRAFRFLNTDDPSICGAALSAELRSASRLGLDQARHSIIQCYAANAAFLPYDQREALGVRLLGEWLDGRAGKSRVRDS